MRDADRGRGRDPPKRGRASRSAPGLPTNGRAAGCCAVSSADMRARLRSWRQSRKALWLEAALRDNPPMPPGLFYRLFRAGRMPETITAEIAAEHVLYRTEGIRVALHRSGHVPGASVAAGVNVGWGSFAVTDRRVVGSRGRAKWVDVPWEPHGNGPATLTLDRTGLHVVFDLDRVHPSCGGEMRIDFHDELADDALATFPRTRASFDVDPQKVVRLFGSLKKLPEGQARP